MAGAVVAGVHTAGAGIHRPELPPDVSASAAVFEVASTVMTPNTTPLSALIFMFPLQGFARFSLDVWRVLTSKEHAGL